MPDHLLTLRDAASILRASPQTVRRLIRAGRLSGYRLNRSWRFTRAQVMGALETHTRPELVRLEPLPQHEITLSPSARRAAVALGQSIEAPETCVDTPRQL